MELDLKRFIRDVPDYPKPGILFKDITPLLQSPLAFRTTIVRIALAWHRSADVVVGLDARGFIFGGAVAYEMGLPFVPVRKKGKLPCQTVETEYELEYGKAIAEMHTDAIEPGNRVLVVDDLLATGGTAAAACKLVAQLGGKVVGCAFVVELKEFNGRKRLAGHNPQSLIIFDNEKVLA